MSRTPSEKQRLFAPDLALECPFCGWEEKSKMTLAQHMVKEHPVFFPEIERLSEFETVLRELAALPRSPIHPQIIGLKLTERIEKVLAS